MKKTNTNIKLSLYLATFLTPVLTFAALEGIEDFLISSRKLLNLTIPVIVALAIVFFLWGMGQFILNDAGNEKTRADGKQKMLWGVIALFVMISIMGIIAWVGNTLDIPVDPSGNNVNQYRGPAPFGGDLNA